MNKPPRKHHYLPRFYLAGFTSSGKENDYLHVIDMREKRKWISKPSKVAYQKDFYKVESDKIPPDEIENIHASIEDKAAPVIKGIFDNGSIPTGEDFKILIYFITDLYVRTPRLNNMMIKFIENDVRKMGKNWVVSPEKYHEEQERMKSARVYHGPDIPYEEMKTINDNDQYNIEVIPGLTQSMALMTADQIHPYFYYRKWSLFIAQKNQNINFVCSDGPVSMISANPMLKPGLAMKDTILAIPLSRELALLARFDGDSETIFADRKKVARINSFSIMYSERFIYSATEEFIYLKLTGEIGTQNDFLINGLK